MTTLAVLDVMLVVVIAMYAGLGAAIITDRLLYERRRRRIAALRQMLVAPSRSERDDARLQRRIARMSTSQFQRFEMSGLPRRTSTALARQLIARHGVQPVRDRIAGADGARIWKRIAALRLFVSGSADRHTAHEELERCLRSGEPPLAHAAIRLLIELNDRRSAAVLLEALRDQAAEPARLAAAFLRLTVARGDLLSPLFHHGSAGVRAWVARLAGRLRARESSEDVRALTRDADPIVRRCAMEALGRMGDESDAEYLRAGLLDPAPIVRTWAARGIASLRSDTIAGATP